MKVRKNCLQVRLWVMLWVMLCVLCCVMGQASAQTSIAPVAFKFGRFGDAVVYRAAQFRHVAFYFSDMTGLDAVDRATIAQLAGEGILVAAVDLRHYAFEIAKPRDRCSYLAGEFEDFSHELQKRFSPQRYHMPVLIGRGRAAGLIYGVMTQGSSGTFVGAVTINFESTWNPLVQLCQSYGLRYDMKAGAVAFKPTKKLSTPWIDLSSNANPTHEKTLKAFVAATVTGKSVAGSTPDKVLASVQEMTKIDREPAVRVDALRDLPLDEVRASGPPSKRFALFLTGDGGWAEIDKGVSAELAKRGVDVVALSSLQYFWKPRSPQETANDVARILRHYSSAWNKNEVLLIGYSFGADAAPFVINRLPTDVRSRIVAVNLLGLAESADFEVHVTGWLGVDHHGLPVQPELARMSERVLCVFGKGENDSLCPKLKGGAIEIAQVGDGHHFGNRYRELAQKILAHSEAGIATPAR